MMRYHQQQIESVCPFVNAVEIKMGDTYLTTGTRDRTLTRWRRTRTTRTRQKQNTLTKQSVPHHHHRCRCRINTHWRWSVSLSPNTLNHRLKNFFQRVWAGGTRGIRCGILNKSPEGLRLRNGRQAQSVSRVYAVLSLPSYVGSTRVAHTHTESSPCCEG